MTTLGPTGQPQTQVMWVDCDDEAVIFNTEVHRQTFKNLSRDPRVTITIWDRQNPYLYAEVRGRVGGIERGPEARRHIDRLSQKYNGRPRPDANIRSERVVVRVRPPRQRLWGSPSS